MNLVYDVNAVFKKRRSESDLVLHIAYVADTVVACRVHFDNVRGDAAVAGSAGFAFVARVAVNGIFAVDGLGKDLSAAGLTSTAGAAEQIGVRELTRRDLIFQNIGNSLLSAYVVEIGRTVFTVKCFLICHLPLLKVDKNKRRRRSAYPPHTPKRNSVCQIEPYTPASISSYTR